MKIFEFNSKKGIFNFEVDEIQTCFHAHPVTEILFSDDGGIDLEIEKSLFKNLSFAVIYANTPHKVSAKKGKTRVIMIECFSGALDELCRKYEMSFEDGIFYESKSKDYSEFLRETQELVTLKDVLHSSNFRVQECLNYLNSECIEYSQMVEDLKSRINLSESRLSHVFKKETGISLKKYSVWCRLKKAFQLVLDEELNMYQAALESGFYDQAHMSKSFKQMLGMSPSDKYNSRMLQD